MWPKSARVGKAQGGRGSLGTAETHLMRLTLVDVKSLPGWGSWLGCTTAILGTTAIDKEKHTGTSFWFPKKQKKKKKQSGEQAIPKRVLQKRSSAISRSYSTTSSYQFLLGKLWLLRDSTHYNYPPYSPLSTQYLLPALAALALPLIRNTNKPKKRRATTTTRRQTTLRAIKTVWRHRALDGARCGVRGSCGWISGGAAAGGAGAAALAAALAATTINGQRCRRGKCVIGQFRAGRRRLI